jgi:fructose-1,6-bisphosphatase
MRHEPQFLHERAPFVFGARDEVARVEELFRAQLQATQET